MPTRQSMRREDCENCSIRAVADLTYNVRFTPEKADTRSGGVCFGSKGAAPADGGHVRITPESRTLIASAGIFAKGHFPHGRQP